MFRMIGLSIEISKEDTATFGLSCLGEGLYFDFATKVVVALKHRPRGDVTIWSKELKRKSKKVNITWPFLWIQKTLITQAGLIGGMCEWWLLMERCTPFAPQRSSILEVVGDVWPL